MELPPAPKCCQEYLAAYIANNLAKARAVWTPKRAKASRKNGRKGGRPPGSKNKPGHKAGRKDWGKKPKQP